MEKNPKGYKRPLPSGSSQSTKRQDRTDVHHAEKRSPRVTGVMPTNAAGVRDLVDLERGWIAGAGAWGDESWGDCLGALAR
jgi:hypothetical protein